jgi:hypothetical protein
VRSSALTLSGSGEGRKTHGRSVPGLGESIRVCRLPLIPSSAPEVRVMDKDTGSKAGPDLSDLVPGKTAARRDHGHLELNQVRRQYRQ